MQDIGQHEEDIALMKVELEEAQEREKEADAVLKASDCSKMPCRALLLYIFNVHRLHPLRARGAQQLS